MFRYRRRLHRWATRVLLLWFFGIGAGFANACVGAHWAAANEHGPRPVVTAQAPDPAIAPAGHHGSRLDGIACHDHPPLKTNCQDFCEKSTISIPPLKLALDHAGADAVPPPPAEMLCRVALREPLQAGVPRRDGGLAPPIAIALLRLTL